MVIPAGDGMVLCCVDVDSVTHENIQQFQECSRQDRWLFLCASLVSRVHGPIYHSRYMKIF